jgi:hypothetical protein
MLLLSFCGESGRARGWQGRERKRKGGLLGSRKEGADAAANVLVVLRRVQEVLVGAASPATDRAAQFRAPLPL